VVVLTEVYSAGEQAIEGADGRTLARAIRARGRSEPVFVAEAKQLPEVLPDLLHDGDLLLLQGAGSIGALAERLRLQGHLRKAV
jgi:UDP-N-acetylmuramate--alanine ligase